MIELLLTEVTYYKEGKTRIILMKTMIELLLTEVTYYKEGRT